METNGSIRRPQEPTEGIDFSKLWMTIKNNLVWIIIIFATINLLTYLLFIRYTPAVYESQSEIKLDIKNEASELGINTLVEDPNLNIIAGEIELIQSKLFLNRVLDSLPLDVSYFNRGDILNYELFGNTPFTVSYRVKSPSAFDVPVYVERTGQGTFMLRFGDEGEPVAGQFEKPVSLDGVDVTLHVNNDFKEPTEVNCFFVINSKDVLVNYLANNLTVEPLNFNANTIRISFRDYNPLKANRIVNQIDTLYLYFSNEQKNQANRQKITWLTNELNQIEEKMGQYENYFEDFILENKTNDLDKELSNTIATIHKIDSQRFEMTRRVNEVNQINDQIESGTFYVGAHQRQFFPEITNEKLDELSLRQLEFDRLKMSYKEVTFAFRERERELRSLQDDVAAQLNDLKTSWLDRLQTLNRQKSDLENQFALMPDRNTQFNKNQRFYKLYEEFYLMLMESKSQFEIAQAGTTPDFKILSPATISFTPIAPKKIMILGIGLVLSLVINFFFIGTKYLMNNRITSVQEIERYNLAPLLGIVPVSRENGSGLHVLSHPRSMTSEAFRTLRTNLDFFHASSAHKVIAVSSTVAGEGKSFVALNLGAIVSLSRKKVLLIDLDMRKPKKPHSPAVQAQGDKGVSTVLIRKHTWQESIIRTELENLDYLPCGPQPPNPSELLLNGEFKEMLDELKQHYEVIILDTPPVGLVTDGIMAMKQADVSIYVFRANYSRKDFISNLQRILGLHKFSSITILLNAMPVNDRKAYGYGYYDEPTPGKLKSILKI